MTDELKNEVLLLRNSSDFCCATLVLQIMSMSNFWTEVQKRDFAKKTYLFDVSPLVLQVIPKNILMIGPTGN